MNVSGKSLQDIYDAGARRLEELQNSQTTTLADTAHGHLSACVKVEPESHKQLEDKTEELEREIRAYLSRGLERVEKSVSAESQQNERYISRVVESLVLLSKKFSESIGQLREAAESELNDLCSDNQDLFAAHTRSIDSQLADEAACALDSCRGSGGEAETSMSGMINDSWETVLEAETDATDTLISRCDDDIAEIEELSKKTKSNLHVGLAENLMQVDERHVQATCAIRAKVDQLVDQSERHAFTADVKLKERFSTLLFDMSSSFDDLAGRATSEMSSLHESSMADLSMKSQELSREMDTLAETVSDSAATKSMDLQKNGTVMIETYTNDLNERLQSNNIFHKDLKSERERLVAEIRDELVEVRTAFEDKLSSIARSTLSTMRTICGEAEGAINSAQQTCAGECKSQAAARQGEIEATAQKFMKKIASTRGAALEAINKAAGAAGDDAADYAADPAASKKTRAISKSGYGASDTGSVDAENSAEDSIESMDASDRDESISTETDVKSVDVESARDPEDTISLKSAGDMLKDPAQLLVELDDGLAPRAARPGDTVTGVESRKRKKDRKNSDKRSSGDKK